MLVDLVRRADVLVENFRTGVLDRLGLGFESLQELNPRLVVLSITGFGHDGPEGGRAGYDQIAQGEAGLMSLTGSGPDDPQKVGVPISDLLAGMYGAYGVLAALLERERTGEGTVVRTSLLAATVGVHAFQGTRWTVAGRGRPGAGQPPRLDRAVRAVPLRRRHRADRAGQREPVAPVLRRLRPRPGDPRAGDQPGPGGRTATRRSRSSRRPSPARTAEALLARLAEVGIPAGKVRTLDDVYAWDQVASQGLTIEVEHGTLGRLTLPGPPLRFFDRYGGEVTRDEHAAPPTLDQHGAAVRDWLGREDSVAGLRKPGRVSGGRDAGR